MLDPAGAGHRRGVLIADRCAVAVIVLLQLGVAVVSFMSLFAFAMGTDSCAYEACGDPAWTSRALWTIPVAAVAAAISALLGFVQLSRRKIGFWILLVGLIIQISVVALGWWMAAKAGPIR